MLLGRRSHSAADLVDLLGGRLIGSAGILVNQAAPLLVAASDQVAFLSSSHSGAAPQDVRAGVVILSPRHAELCQGTRIVVEFPNAYFARVMSLFNPVASIAHGVDSRAIVHPTARLGPRVNVGPATVIEEGAVLGAGSSVMGGCCIGARTVIGSHGRIHSHVTISEGCTIGDRVVIHSGAVVGSDGFGMARDGVGWQKIPHVGSVVVGNDVEIGANTTIDRGTMSDTIIEDGVKLDNQVQIAHNVRVGAHCAIAACVGIAGSATIGPGCTIGGGAIILGHLSLVGGTDVSAGTVVTKSISSPGRYTGIYPFDAHKRWKVSAVRVRQI